MFVTVNKLCKQIEIKKQKITFKEEFVAGTKNRGIKCHEHYNGFNSRLFFPRLFLAVGIVCII